MSYTDWQTDSTPLAIKGQQVKTRFKFFPIKCGRRVFCFVFIVYPRVCHCIVREALSSVVGGSIIWCNLSVKHFKNMYGMSTNVDRI